MRHSRLAHYYPAVLIAPGLLRFRYFAIFWQSLAFMCNGRIQCSYVLRTYPNYTVAYGRAIGENLSLGEEKPDLGLRKA